MAESVLKAGRKALLESYGVVTSDARAAREIREKITELVEQHRRLTGRLPFQEEDEFDEGLLDFLKKLLPKGKKAPPPPAPPTDDEVKELYNRETDQLNAIHQFWDYVKRGWSETAGMFGIGEYADTLRSLTKVANRYPKDSGYAKTIRLIVGVAPKFGWGEGRPTVLHPEKDFAKSIEQAGKMHGVDITKSRMYKH